MKKKSIPASLIISLLLLAAAALLSAAARRVPGFAQWYSVTIYPALQGSLGRLTGLAGFSVAEILIPTLAIFFIILAVVFIIRRKKILRPLARYLRILLFTISILLLLYTANCGINYYREPFTDREVCEKAAFTEDDLALFCEYAVKQINASCERSDNAAVYPEGEELADRAVLSMDDLSEHAELKWCDTGSLGGFYPRPKELTFMSRLFSMMGVSGIYSPFTIEANINGEMPGLEKPFTACHELSHLKGHMNEGEANYIGWLACILSDDPAFQRSGWLIAWIYAGNSLSSIDPERYQKIRSHIPAEALRELEDNTLFWQTHENKASEIQDKVNDTYLKSNGQEDGIRTYGRLTTLMLIWYDNEKSDRAL